MELLVGLVFWSVFIAGILVIIKRDNGSEWGPGRSTMDVGFMFVGWLALFFLIGAALSKYVFN